MPSKKKVWNMTTPYRYRSKVIRLLKGQGVPEQLAIEHGTMQTAVWQMGAGAYRDVRAEVAKILDKYGIKPHFRGTFQAYGQWLAKQLAKGDYSHRTLWLMAMEKWGFEGKFLTVAREIAQALGLDFTKFQKPEAKPEGKAGRQPEVTPAK